ncbi:unnamed protein product, partial [Hapterophycus canaliculatus]
MSWVLTWFSHDLQDLATVARLYDVLLGAHPTLILYISAAVSRRPTVTLNLEESREAVQRFPS